MNKKIIGILVCSLMIATIVPAMGSIEEDVLTRKHIESNNLLEKIKNGYFYGCEGETTNYEEQLVAIRKAIEKKNANWTAGYTSIFGPDSDVECAGLGCLKEYVDQNEYVPINYKGALPDEFDWRNVDGVDWMTSVKSQSGCGSCVAFGTLGALEAVVQIEVGYPFGCDLSEAHLFFCGGGNCDSGWKVSEAADFVKKTGVSDEACFPYEPYDMPCDDKASNWKSRVVKVTSRGPAMREQDIKRAIMKYGPVSTAFDVYQDFRSYERGIYEHVWGEKVSGHCVSIVGYNDNPGYWICKNSHGKNWGEKGYIISMALLAIYRYLCLIILIHVMDKEM
jgi:C1A family cysteine protease